MKKSKSARIPPQKAQLHSALKTFSRIAAASLTGEVGIDPMDGAVVEALHACLNDIQTLKDTARCRAGDIAVQRLAHRLTNVYRGGSYRPRHDKRAPANAVWPHGRVVKGANSLDVAAGVEAAWIEFQASLVWAGYGDEDLGRTDVDVAILDHSGIAELGGAVEAARWAAQQLVSKNNVNAALIASRTTIINRDKHLAANSTRKDEDRYAVGAGLGVTRETGADFKFVLRAYGCSDTEIDALRHRWDPMAKLEQHRARQREQREKPSP